MKNWRYKKKWRQRWTIRGKNDVNTTNTTKVPELFGIVTSQMIYCPCGNRNRRSPCMKDGKCPEGFPKPLVKETQTGQDSYPEYRRRSPDDGGFCHEIKKGDDIIKVGGNEWVVPHNLFLLETFNAHLNVEFANSVKSIKYICKYDGLVLKSAKLIVWDECSMSHKKAFEALDRTLKDLKENNLLFGGVTFLICGNFRQTLPVVPKGTTADEYNACLKKSVLWRSVERFQLTINMRVHLRGDQGASLFASLLLQICNGQVPKGGDNLITVPEGCGTLVETKEELIDKVYPNLEQHYKDVEWLRDRAILAPKNTVVSELNEK